MLIATILLRRWRWKLRWEPLHATFFAKNGRWKSFWVTLNNPKREINFLHKVAQTYQRPYLVETTKTPWFTGVVLRSRRRQHCRVRQLNRFKRTLRDPCFPFLVLIWSLASTELQLISVKFLYLESFVDFEWKSGPHFELAKKQR